MKRYHETVLILVSLFFLTILWAMSQEQSKPYKVYQEIYQARKIEQLKAKESTGLPEDQRQEVLNEIQSLRKNFPKIQQVVLKDGNKERCLTCHIGIELISDSHPVETLGCTICHGGDPLSVTLPAAHQGLIGGRNPSDFRVVDQGCGRKMPDGTACHNGDPAEERDHIKRVKTTIMATEAGEIANPRFSFGAQKSLQAIYGVVSIQGKEPEDRAKTVQSLQSLPYTRETDLPVDEAGEVIRTDTTGEEYTFSGHRVDTQLHQKCVNQCHLWSKGIEQAYLNRASGCASCHYLYDNNSFYQGDDPTIPRDEPGHGPYHRMTLKIPYSQCNHCHNRGVHSLFKMDFDERADLDDLRELSGDEHRVKDYYQPMTLFSLCEYKLDCIDCHTDQEVMGDGFLYHDKIAQQRIRCYTCHGTLENPPVIRRLTDRETPKVQRIMRTYSRKPFELALFSDDGEILPHVRVDEGKLYLTGKATEKTFYLPLVSGSNCKQDPRIQEANNCHTCHEIHLNQK